MYGTPHTSSDHLPMRKRNTQMPISYLLLPIVLLLAASWLPLLQSSRSDFSILGYDPDDAGSVRRVEELFELWMERYEKAYRSEEEKKARFRNFLSNLAYVVENRPGEGWRPSSWTRPTVGLNKFADMSNEEFKQVYSARIRRPEGKERAKRASPEAACLAPRSVDWKRRGVVTGVKDQRNCGMYVECFPIPWFVPSLTKDCIAFLSS